MNAVNLKIAEQYVSEFGNLAKTNNTVIIPTNLSDIAGMVKSVTTVLQEAKETK
ncbi:MAG: band-7 C-terminal domain-containing protein [bacterium]